MTKYFIGDKFLNIPVIQGGMGVGISLENLAGNVAKNGAMGVISMVNIGYREENFYKDRIKANIEGFKKSISRAREIAEGNGLLGVNIMQVITDFEDCVKVAVKERVDAIIVGAGLPLNLPSLVDKGILIAPIVSSKKALKVIMEYWEKNYNRRPDFVVVEGSSAGGHLGFKKREIDNDNYSLEKIAADVNEFLRDKKTLDGAEIPFFVGGSAFDGYDLKKYRDLGAMGIQIGTRFIATEECDASSEFKNLLVNSTSDDLTIFKSPAGLLGRGINTKLLQDTEIERKAPKRCVNCLKTCDFKTTKFCISEALIQAVKGNIEDGLFFSGKNIDRINEVTTVEEVMKSIVKEWE